MMQDGSRVTPARSSRGPPRPLQILPRGPASLCPTRPASFSSPQWVSIPRALLINAPHLHHIQECFPGDPQHMLTRREGQADRALGHRQRRADFQGPVRHPGSRRTPGAQGGAWAGDKRIVTETQKTRDTQELCEKRR